MSRRQERLPVQIDPYRLAEQGRELEGSLPIHQMRRLAPLLADQGGEIQVSLEFGVDETGVRYVQGRLAGQLTLRCQRCLEQMQWPVAAELALGFVASSHAAEALAGGYEPYIVESVPVALVDMIEDELILVLPQIPMHELQDCPARVYVGQAAEEPQDHAVEENPFLKLAQLKTPDKAK